MKVIVWDILTLFGEWPDMAVYTPRLLRLYAEGEWGEDEMLLKKLLLAARPELSNLIPGWPPQPHGPPMPSNVRRSIFSFVQVVLRERIHLYPYNDWLWHQSSLPGTLAFLAAFDVPLDPFIQEWQESEDQMARANLCLLLADYTLNNTPRKPLLKNIYIDHLTLLPENHKALETLFTPESVAACLLAHASDAERFGPDWETGVGPAFDWATQQS